MAELHHEESHYGDMSLEAILEQAELQRDRNIEESYGRELDIDNTINDETEEYNA